MAGEVNFEKLVNTAIFDRKLDDEELVRINEACPGASGAQLANAARTVFTFAPQMPEKVKESTCPIFKPGAANELYIQHVVTPRLRSAAMDAFERELARDPELTGELVISVRLNPNGTIAKVLIENTTINNKTVEYGIIRSLERAKFPNVPDGTSINIRYPINFKAEKVPAPFP
ncbi:MAG TPA: hypothetical protein DDW49_08055 [Deltaproteobacteria bacterium]|nr:MAG: hypothetical protein A2048_05935 [Deltaproteobacteria bacterium GWA2_45_12]HBF13317.1 hypothetical protein [Deltaproteobacteria bacterium]